MRVIQSFRLVALLVLGTCLLAPSLGRAYPDGNRVYESLTESNINENDSHLAKQERNRLAASPLGRESSYGSFENILSHPELAPYNSELYELERQESRIHPSRSNVPKVNQIHRGGQSYNKRPPSNQRAKHNPSLKVTRLPIPSRKEECECPVSEAESSKSQQRVSHLPYNQESNYQQIQNSFSDFQNNPNEQHVQNDFTRPYNQGNSFAQSEYLNALSQRKYPNVPVQQQEFSKAHSQTKFIEGEPDLSSPNTYFASQSQDEIFSAPASTSVNSNQRNQPHNGYLNVNNQAYQNSMFEMGAIQGNNELRVTNGDSNTASISNVYEGETVDPNAEFRSTFTSDNAESHAVTVSNKPNDLSSSSNTATYFNGYYAKPNVDSSATPYTNSYIKAADSDRYPYLKSDPSAESDYDGYQGLHAVSHFEPFIDGNDGQSIDAHSTYTPNHYESYPGSIYSKQPANFADSTSITSSNVPSTSNPSHSLGEAESFSKSSMGSSSSGAEAFQVYSQGSPNRPNHLSQIEPHSSASPEFSISGAEPLQTSSQNFPNKPGQSLSQTESHINVSPGFSSNGAESLQISPQGFFNRAGQSLSQTESHSNASPGFSSNGAGSLQITSQGPQNGPNYLSQTESHSRVSPGSSSSGAEAFQIPSYSQSSSGSSSGDTRAFSNSPNFLNEAESFSQSSPDFSSNKLKSFSTFLPNSHDPDKDAATFSHIIYINPYKGFTTPYLPSTHNPQSDTSSQSSTNYKHSKDEYNSNAKNVLVETSHPAAITNNGCDQVNTVSADSEVSEPRSSLQTHTLPITAKPISEQPSNEKPLEKLKTVVSGIVEAISESCACSVCHESGKSTSNIPYKTKEEKNSNQPISIAPGALPPIVLSPTECSKSETQSKYQPNLHHQETSSTDEVTPEHTQQYFSAAKTTPEKIESSSNSSSCGAQSQPQQQPSYSNEASNDSMKLERAPYPDEGTPHSNKESSMEKLRNAVMDIISSSVSKSGSDHNEDERDFLEVIGCTAAAIFEALSEATINQPEGGGNCPAAVFENAATTVLDHFSELVTQKPPHEPTKPSKGSPLDCVTEAISNITDKIVSAVSMISSRNYHYDHEQTPSLPISPNSDPFNPTVNDTACTLEPLTSQLGTPNSPNYSNSNGPSIATSAKDLMNSVVLQLSPPLSLRAYVAPTYVNSVADVPPAQNLLVCGHPNQCSCLKEGQDNAPPNNVYTLPLNPSLYKQQ